MYVTVDPDRRRADLDKSTFLASGGEGEIHIDPAHPRAKVFKIYHQPEERRAQKLEALLRRGGAFPPEVVNPQALVRNDRGEVVGFQMRQLNRRFVKAGELFKPSFCDSAGITGRVKADTFLSVADQLGAIHRNQFLVGDFNDGAFLFNQDDHSVAWVDVDSWDTLGYPCLVGTELYLCPALFGVDLSKGKHFEEWHDWYSYAVLLFRTLLRQHPFKAGIHPTLLSVVQRAQAGVTVLDAGVSAPAALKPEILSDSLIEALLKQLKGQVRMPFPVDVLRQYRDELVGCPSCGVWYPGRRKHCPGCSQRTTVDAARFLDLVLHELVSVRGRILHLQPSGKEVQCIAEEDGKIVVYTGEPGRIVRSDTGLPFRQTMKVGLHKGVLTVADDADPDADLVSLYLFGVGPGGVRPIKATTTTVLRGQGAVTANSNRFVYRLAQSMLLACERFGEHDLLERPVTQVIENQCWFTCDSHPSDGIEVLCGFNRDQSLIRWFVSTCPTGQTTFTTRDVPVSPLRRGETLLDLGVYIRNGECLIARKTRYRGIEHVKLDLVDAKTFTVVYSTELTIANHPQWESVRGKALNNGVVMHATDRGIVREEVRTQQTTVLKDSQSFVTPDDLLFPFDGGILKGGSNRVGLIGKR